LLSKCIPLKRGYSLEENVRIVFITAPRGKGADIAREILSKRLAACVNIVRVGSLYWWKGNLEEDEEDLLIAKTTKHQIPKLQERVREIHPYEVPEFLVLPIEDCYPEYCKWVIEETLKKQE
jgi:periplasmic divalent cation tolerance protein